MNHKMKRAAAVGAATLLGFAVGACVRQAPNQQPTPDANAQSGATSGTNEGTNNEGTNAGVGTQTSPSNTTVRNVNDLQQLSATYAAISSRVTPAIVNINTRQTEGATDDPFGGGEGQPQVRQGTGSGVIVDGRGLILTNNHVVEGAQQITVTLTDKRRFRGRVLGTDPATDIAVVKIEPQGKLPTLQFANSDAIRVGDIVLAVGSPLGLASSVTQGIISAKGRSNLGISQYEDFLQTDAAINPGNSGGALVDVTGRLVGINTAILSRSGGNQGIGLAIPSNLARKISGQLVANGKVTRGYLGLGTVTVTDDIAQQLNMSESRGVLVTGVVRDGPAGNLPWVRRGGNVITTFNGTAVESEGQLRNLIANTAPGTKVTLGVQQPDGAKQFSVVVGRRSAQS